MSKEQRDSEWSRWPLGVLTWCKGCGDDDYEYLRACPVCGDELCWWCGKHHVCADGEEEG